MATWNLVPKILTSGGVRFEAALINEDNNATILSVVGADYDEAYNALIDKINKYMQDKKKVDAFFEREIPDRQFTVETPTW